ncbi:thioredoxin M-type, chloroplastic, partial [Tanacetum coccineum]
WKVRPFQCWQSFGHHGGPCRTIAPVVDELAKEYAGKALCYNINTYDCPNIASKLGIRSIPTVICFKNGEKRVSLVLSLSPVFVLL